MDFSSVITGGSLPHELITIVRRGAGSYVKGIHSGGSTTNISTTAIVYPATPKELKLLPEGMHTEGAIGIISNVLLRTANEASGTQADRITYNSCTYEIQQISDWDANGNFYHGIATKVN